MTEPIYLKFLAAGHVWLYKGKLSSAPRKPLINMIGEREMKPSGILIFSKKLSCYDQKIKCGLTLVCLDYSLSKKSYKLSLLSAPIITLLHEYV